MSSAPWLCGAQKAGPVTEAVTDPIHEMLAERPWLLADGATGTNLFLAGLGHGDAPELWNVTNTRPVYDLAKAFVDAGADIFLTNSFGGTRHRLKLHKAEDRVAELNIAAARLGREAADSVERRVLVAGSIGPTGELFEPLGPLTMADGIAAFREQGEALAEGGCDVLWVETMSSGPKTLAQSGDELSKIRKSLDKLPRLYREVLVALIVEERDPHEVARERNVTLDTLRKQKNRGLERWREDLDSDGLDPGAVLA